MDKLKTWPPDITLDLVEIEKGNFYNSVTYISQDFLSTFFDCEIDDKHCLSKLFYADITALAEWNEEILRIKKMPYLNLYQVNSEPECSYLFQFFNSFNRWLVV